MFIENRSEEKYKTQKREFEMQATAQRNLILGTLTGIVLASANLFLTASPAIAGENEYNNCKNYLRVTYVNGKYSGDWDQYMANKTLVENSLHNACRHHAGYPSDKTPAFFYN